MPLGPQEKTRDTRDEAGQRRGRLNSHCTQQSHCTQLSHRRRYRRPTPGEEEERNEAPLPYHRHVEEAKPLAIGEEGEASLSHLEAASVLLPKQTPATGEHEDLLRDRHSNVEVAVSNPFFARDLAASSDEMNYPLDDAAGGLQGMPRVGGGVTPGAREEDADSDADGAREEDADNYPLDGAGLQGMPRVTPGTREEDAAFVNERSNMHKKRLHALISLGAVDAQKLRSSLHVLFTLATLPPRFGLRRT
mmetsp:Transcript_15076/g.54330  ORF Transcript_15076/g.54330 Transcript_15076/m.54330 type:complete len:249 (+) Transcript_15076:440-1186(+)